jgi:plastocyanin
MALPTVSLALLAAVACGPVEVYEPDVATPAAPIGVAPDLSQAGRIVGDVTFNGAVVEAAVLDMTADPNCARLQRSEQHRASSVRVNRDGGLRGVLVYVSAGLDGLSFPDPSPEEPLFGFDLGGVLHQADCMFRPPIVALRVGQPLTIRNSDDTLHNVSARPASGLALNVSQPMPGLEHQHVFERAEIGIAVRCDVHPWMEATIHVFEHPYFSVTDEDFGIDLGPLPAGQYTVSARHEILGTLTQAVTVGANETVEIAFTFEP